MAATLDLFGPALSLALGRAGLHKQATQTAPAVGTPGYAKMQKRIVQQRALGRGAGQPQVRHSPGANFPLIEDAPGHINPVAAGVRGLHSTAKPGLAQFEGNMGFLNPLVDFAWNQMLPPSNNLQGQNPYSANPWMYNTPEVFRQGAQTASHALNNFRSYENGLSPALAPYLPLLQQFGPQLMSKMGSAKYPLGLMF